MTAIDRLIALLPSHLQAKARQLIHLIWMRPDLRFFYAALLRFQQLLTDYPMAFPQTVHQSVDRRAVHDLLEELRNLPNNSHATVTAEDRLLIADVLADPAAEAIQRKGRHPNASRISAHPLQTALLTARSEADPLRQAHDRITAMYVGRAIANHIALTDWDWYRHAIEKKEPDEKQAERHASAERNAMLAIRTLQSPEAPDSLVRDVGVVVKPDNIQPIRLIITGAALPKHFDEHLRYLQSFLAERHRAKGERDDKEGAEIPAGVDDDNQTTPVDKKADATPQTLHKPDHPTTFHGTGFLSPAFIEEDEQEAEGDQDIEQISALPDDGLEMQAIDHDLPVESLRKGPGIFLANLTADDVERIQDESALSVVTHNQAMLIRRHNQLQRAPDYVPLDLRRIAITELIALGMQAHDDAITSIPLASAAAVHLAAIATGRSPARLANGALQVIKRAEDLDEHSQGVAYVINSSQWLLSVRLPRTQAQPVPGARPVHNWLLVPDLLGCGAVMARFAEEAEQGRHSHLDIAMRHVNEQLRRRTGLQGEQLWQWLPRALLERDGCFATLAQLTDATILNSSVDLHYLTASRRGALLRYVAGMRHLLGEPPLTHEAADRLMSDAAPGFIGLPNTPHWDTVRATVQVLAQAICRPDLAPQERHNAYTLYTIAMLTLALGRRHAIDVDVRMQWVGDTPIALFHEKGENRLLVVPERLQRQLDYYKAHRAVVAAWSSLKPGLTRLGNPEFFLISPAGPELFRPTRFGEYVRDLGADFQLPLNSLRRLAYSELIDAGLGGIVADAFMGHAAYGREPLVPGSALRLRDLANVAEEINITLQRHDWEPLPGPFHA